MTSGGNSSPMKNTFFRFLPPFLVATMRRPIGKSTDWWMERERERERGREGRREGGREGGREEEGRESYETE